MAKINHDILGEIFYKICSNPNSMVKFMLAGKENFKFTLDNYGQAKEARIQSFSETKQIITLSSIDSLGNNKKSVFQLDFPLLKAFTSEIEELNVPHITFVDDYVKSILKHLIGENLKKITVKPKMEASYYVCMKNFQKLEYIDISCPDFDISMISESCRILKINDIDWNCITDSKTFSKIIKPLRFQCAALTSTKKSNNKKINITSVEELNLEGDLNSSDFTPEKFEHFISFISIHFPKLRLMDVLFRVEGGWEENKDLVLGLETSIFKKLSSNIKGCINFNTMDFPTLSEYRNERRMLPNDCTAREDNAFQKTLQIHDGLKFYFVCQFFMF